MNESQAREALKKAQIPRGFYSFDSDGDGECYRITPEGSRWHVYYAERGGQNTIAWCDQAEAAYQYFVDTILGDTAIQQFMKNQK